jgi:hypothetical protein
MSPRVLSNFLIERTTHRSIASIDDNTICSGGASGPRRMELLFISTKLNQLGPLIGQYPNDWYDCPCNGGVNVSCRGLSHRHHFGWYNNNLEATSSLQTCSYLVWKGRIMDLPDMEHYLLVLPSYCNLLQPHPPNWNRQHLQPFQAMRGSHYISIQ